MKRWNTALCFGFLILCLVLPGCGEESSPPSPVNDFETAREMKSWFEMIDYRAEGYSSLEEALEGVYQDEGYTTGLYRELENLVNQASTNSADYDSTFRTCQEWFEMIDHEASGYSSLEEAIEDIYPDDGYTLELYKKLKARNAGSS